MHKLFLIVMKNNPYIQNAKGVYINDYNVLQVKIDNDMKQFLDKGLVPLSDEEIFNLYFKGEILD